MSIPATSAALYYHPGTEDYDPHRALCAAVIIQAIKDYCEARRDKIKPKRVRKGARGQKYNDYIMCPHAETKLKETEAFLCGTDDRKHSFFPYVNMPFATPSQLDKVFEMYSVHGSVSGEAAAAMFRREARDGNG